MKHPLLFQTSRLLILLLISAFRIKVIFTLLACFFLFGKVYSQNIPNSDFESWNPIPFSATKTPVGWSTSVGSGFGGGADSSSLSFSGQSALILSTWYSYLPGTAINGNCFNCSTLDDFRKAGTPMNSRPLSLSGYYHFELGAVDPNNLKNDSAIALILLKKYNHSQNKIDTVGMGFKSFPANSNYQSFTIPINYLSNDTPDSIVVGFFSNDQIMYPQGGQRNNCLSNSYCMNLKIDQLSLQTSTSTSVEEHLVKSNTLTTFPNPASNQINVEFDQDICSYSIYDIKGVLILQNEINCKSNFQIDIESCSKGLHIINFKTQDGRVFQEKLIVTK